MINLKEQLEANFESRFRDFLREMGAFAGLRKQSIFIVGGFVRDLVLGRPSMDLDLMLLSDATEFVKFLHAKWQNHFPEIVQPKKPIAFKKYKTAKLPFREEIFPGLSIIDFSSARKEFYAHSGARPELACGTLHEDLARRDFSVNALALSLAEESFADVIDYFSGIRDLELKQIRILEEESFFKDPARLIRAVRLIARLDFRLEEKTALHFKEAVAKNYLANLPLARLKDEFEKAFSESDKGKVSEKLEEYDLLKQYRSILCN